MNGMIGKLYFEPFRTLLLCAAVMVSIMQQMPLFSFFIGKYQTIQCSMNIKLADLSLAELRDEHYIKIIMSRFFFILCVLKGWGGVIEPTY
jgi:hypothetical protein